MVPMLFKQERTHGFSDAKQKAEKNKKRREIGEIWEEEINGTIYTIEQQNGFRVKKPKNSVANEIR